MTKIKKIDIHAHVVPKSKKTLPNWLNEEELIKIYDELNIEKGVLLPFLPSEATNENAEFTVSLRPDRFIRFVSVDLAKADDIYEFLSAQKALGAKGVGEITSNIYFDDKFSASSSIEGSVESHYMALAAEKSRLEGGKLVLLTDYRK